jgi:hypothetical protein
LEERIVISRVLIKKQPGRRWLTFVAAVGLLVTSMGIAGSALAVQNLTFQLDGNAKAADCGPVSAGNLGGTAPNCLTQTLDWDSLFNADTSAKTLPSGFTQTTFVRDFGVNVSAQDKCSTTNRTSTIFCTADPTTYATGSKDTLNITPGWQCNTDHNVNSKIDIMNGYAAAYTVANPSPDSGEAPGDLVLYFALEKNKDNGNNNVGFWFLQGGANCVSAGGNTPWTGDHQDGDILITSAFTSGGGVSNIGVFKWTGGATGCIDNPANPKLCDQEPFGTGGDCKGASINPEPAICATTNSGPLITNTSILVPWLTSDATIGVGHTIVPPDFFEGAIDLTRAFTGVGQTAPSCFSTFIADTRSSQSPTATLFDYARGTLGNCGATIQTTPSLTTTSLGSTDAITDLANIAGTASGGGTAPKPTGTVSFFLCGPLTSALGCTTGGTPVTAVPANTLGNCSPDVAGHSCATSGNVRSLVTAGGIGWYCFRGVYDPGTDPNYQSSAGILDGSTTECFNVTDTSSIVTDQNWLPQDSATVSTTGGSAVSGTVTFTMYEDADCGVTAPTAVKGTFTDSSAPFTTTNSTVYTASQTISWKATFVSDNGVGTSISSCETSTVNINNNHP